MEPDMKNKQQTSPTVTKKVLSGTESCPPVIETSPPRTASELKNVVEAVDKGVSEDMLAKIPEKPDFEEKEKQVRKREKNASDPLAAVVAYVDTARFIV